MLREYAEADFVERTVLQRFQRLRDQLVALQRPDIAGRAEGKIGRAVAGKLQKALRHLAHQNGLGDDKAGNGAGGNGIPRNDGGNIGRYF